MPIWKTLDHILDKQFYNRCTLQQKQISPREYGEMLQKRKRGKRK